MFNGYILLALALAVAAPLALIATRQELQAVRAQIVEDLRQTLFKDQYGLPQIELVAARYRTRALVRRQLRQEKADPSEGPWTTRNDQILIWHGALAFVTASFLGFCLLLTPTQWLISATPEFPRLATALLWVAPGGKPEDVMKTAAVAGMGFLGAYTFWLGFLIRATLNEELSALAFVRAALGMIGSILLVIVVYRTMGSLDKTFALSLGLAFLIGAFPNQGIAKIAKWLGVDIKGVSRAAMEGIEVIPLQVIDGIDNEASVRLQESNLYDVQNLATTNPIELYAETPFGLFETFDWVLQAQLCVIVGAATFKRLKAHNIRTIFDLERAVLAKDAPEPYVQAIGSVIFEGASEAFRKRLDLPAKDDVTVENKVSVGAVRHAVAIIGDDLHVHRLRALWTAMLHTTSSGTRQWLYETGPLPGEIADLGAGLAAQARAAVNVAASLGEAFRAAAENQQPAERLALLKAEVIATAKSAISLDPRAAEHLRLLFRRDYLRKEPGETSLEVFAGDPEFEALLR
jgi:hypothetical protein